MTREAPSNGGARRKSMPKRAPREATEAWQLELLLNADRITQLDARSRMIVVSLLARMLLEAAQNPEKEVADDEA
jgi:hypothetical protein